MEPMSLDQHDQLLIERTQPGNWSAPSGNQSFDLVVVGAGPAGLVAAVIAAGLGAKTALIERHRLGGDCLHTGCVPSKALLASARQAYQTQPGGQESPAVDFPQIMARMRELRARLGEHDAAQRFQQLGIDVFFGQARFNDPRTVHVENDALTFRRCILATGSRPVAPSIPGLENVSYLTHETLFSLAELPRRLAIIGAGPIGVEMAQAFHRFGSQVTLIDQAKRLLPREDQEASQLLLNQFQQEGIQVHLDTQVLEAASQGNVQQLQLQTPLRTELVEADQLLVATGRQANVESLDLEAAGISYQAERIQVDDHLRTTNRRIFAAGDVIGDQQFTHAADAMARLCIRNAFFFGRRSWPAYPVPHATYTDPEIAQIGLTAAEADRQGLAIDTYRVPFSGIDRCVLDGNEKGFIAAHCRQGTGQLLGATIAGHRAGELINTFSLLMSRRLSLGTLSNAIHCYPTQSQSLQQLGDQFQRSRLSPWSARLLKRVIGWRR